MWTIVEEMLQAGLKACPDPGLVDGFGSGASVFGRPNSHRKYGGVAGQVRGGVAF